MQPTFDEHGYPTENTLALIRKWDFSDYEGLARFVCAAWNSDYGLFSFMDGKLTLVTGGWSGNEEVLDALNDNQIWWVSYWQSSTRGGRYEFKGEITRDSQQKEPIDANGS